MNREAQHVLDLIVKPLLPLIGMDSRSAQLLMVYTAAVETGFDNLRQVISGGNFGPAIGWWQMEKETFDWLTKYLNKNVEIKNRILSACYLEIIPPAETMIWNIRFACCMARIRYLVVPERLPHPEDLEGMGHYWLKYYNGDGEGKGSLERFMAVCKGLVLA
jgi:hypothetical protein